MNYNMKKILLFGISLLAFASAGAQSEIPTQYLSGEGIKSISSNGKWMVSEMSVDNCIAIRNLETGKAWGYICEGGDFDDRWDMAITRGVADDGTVVGEYNNIPAYWRDGEWIHLNGCVADQFGNVTAIVGGITPDGSVIVGSIGKGGSMYDEVDSQMTFPCLWYRQDDGTYGDPVWLPNPGKDYFGQVPQYLNATSISDDGKTVGALMRSGMGFHHFAFAYHMDDSGEWQYSMIGESLINPRNIPISPYPGEYHGPNYPNYEEYMTPQQLAAFFQAGNAWIDDLYRQGITDENEIALLELEFAMEFMSPDRRAEYEPLLRDFLAQYPAWQKAFDAYLDFLDKLDSQAAAFLYNNVWTSPDGKYVFASATREGGMGGYAPVRYDVATGDIVIYNHTRSVIISGVGDDYSVLAKDYNSNDGIAYIFPEGGISPVSFLDYWKNNEKVYFWMEENMFRDVVVSITAGGAYNTEQKWCMGRPVATPDLSLFGFACSSEYWYPAPADNSFVSTFLINPLMPEKEDNGDSGIDEIGSECPVSVSILAGGIVALDGNILSLDIYDLAGTRIFHASNPEGNVATGISSGAYIITAVSANGEYITKKAIF